MKICTGHDISISCRFYLLSFGLRKSRKFCQKEGQNQQLSQVLPAATRETKQTLIFEPLTPGLQDRHSRCCSTIHWGSKATPSNDTAGKTELWKMGENWVSNHRHLEYNVDTLACTSTCNTLYVTTLLTITLSTQLKKNSQKPGRDVGRPKTAVKPSSACCNERDRIGTEFRTTNPWITRPIL